MSSYSYVAVDPVGVETRGTLEVSGSIEAVRRIKEMGLYPTKVLEINPRKGRFGERYPGGASAHGRTCFRLPLLSGRVSPSALTVFTRQTATLIEAGMPLLRGLRILHEQEENRVLRRVIAQLAAAIESGSSFAEALAMHPRIFNSLFVNMVKAGELSGALELTLKRLSEFMDKSKKLRGRIIAAMFYPGAVLAVAAVILGVMMVFVVPRFQEVFDGLLQGRAMPAFTLWVLKISSAVKGNLVAVCLVVVAAAALFKLGLHTRLGRQCFDECKLNVPALGPVFRKAAISRFTRTLGTLIASGVPILQSLIIVRETAANVVLGKAIGKIHDRVKEGDSIAPVLKTCGVFPPMVTGMVDVGEQTGALPDMLMKIADNYDEEVDNAASAMTSLLEPIMIVFLAVVVGSIVIAMFLPLLRIVTDFDAPPGSNGE